MASPITEDAFPSLLESSYRKVDRQPPPRRVTPPPASEKAQEAPQPTPSDEDNGRKGPPRGSNPQPVRLGDFLSNRQVRFLNNQGRGNDSRKQPRPPPTAAVLVPRLDVNVKKTVNPKATEKLYYQTPTDEAKPPQRKPKQNNGNAQGRNRNGPAAAGNNAKSNANGEANGQNGSASRSGSRQKGPRNQNRGSGNAAEGGQNLSSEEVSKQQTSQRGIPAITNAAELHSPTNQHDNSKQPKKNRQARPQPRNENPAQNDSKSDSHQNPSASTAATTTSTTTTTADANPVANSPKPKRNRRKNDKKALQEGSTNTPTSTPAPSPLPTPTPSQESVQNNSEAPASPAQPKKQNQKKTKYVLKAKENNTVAAENPQLPLENAASSSEQVPVASGDVQQNTPPAKRNNKPKKGKTNKLPEPASAGASSESVSAEVAEPTPALAAAPEPLVASVPEPVVEAAVEATAQATVESVVDDAVAEAAKEEVEPQLQPQIEVAEAESQQPQPLEEDEPCDIRPLDFIDDVPEPLKEEPAAVAVIHADQVAEPEPQPVEVLAPVKLEAELTSLPALSTPAPQEETPTPKPTETPTPKPVDTPTPKPFFTPLPYETPKPKDFITPYETPLPEELTQGKPQEPSFYGTGQLVVGGPNSAVPLIPMPSTAALPTTGTPSTVSPRALVSLSSTPSPASSSPSSQEGTPVFPTPLPIPPLSNSVNLVEDYDKLINFSNVPVTKPKGVLTRVNSSSSLYLLSITNPSPSTSPLPSPRGAPSTVPSFNFTPLETPASITRIVSAPPNYDITSKSAPVTPATSPRATRKGSLTNRAGSKGLLHLF